MTAGPVNRALLESNFQNDGEVYSDEKTEACFDVVADQIDDNWNFVVGLINSGTVQPYPPSFLSRQAVINSNFDIWQRGTSFNNIGNLYTADRWLYNTAGTGMPATVTQSRLSLPVGEIDQTGSFYGYRFSVNGAGTDLATNFTKLSQRIEHGTRYLCGFEKSVTVSFYAKSSIPGKRIGVNIDQTYGTGGAPSASESIAGANFLLSSSWSKYSFTFLTNILTGKTFGTNNDDYVQLSFWYQWGANFLSPVNSVTTETFGGVGVIDIAQVQVCSGTSPIPYQPKTFEEELEWCQRYYEKSYDYNTAPATATVSPGLVQKVVPSNTIPNQQVYGKISFKVKKRATPTITVYPFTTPSNTGRVSDGAGVDLGAGSGASLRVGDDGFCVFNNSGGNLTTAVFVVNFHWASDSEL